MTGKRPDVPTDWTYRGVRVRVHNWGGIPARLRPDADLGGMVQEALDDLEPWEGRMRVVQEHELDWGRIMPAVIPVGPEDQIIWGVRKGTREHDGQRAVSPFTAQRLVRVAIITIELEGYTYRPVLTRAYGGSYVPSLPGTKNVGSKSAVRMTPEERLEFWRTHARPITDLEPGTETTESPWWYRPHVTIVTDQQDFCDVDH